MFVILAPVHVIPQLLTQTFPLDVTLSEQGCWKNQDMACQGQRLTLPYELCQCQSGVLVNINGAYKDIWKANHLKFKLLSSNR